MQRYCLELDDDCNDYLLPIELKGEFRRLLDDWNVAGWLTEASAPIEEEFNRLFSQYKVENFWDRLTFALPELDGEPV